MALINCPECMKEISSLVESCPNCGYPLKKANNMNIVNNNVLQVNDHILNIDEVTVAGQFGYTKEYKNIINTIIIMVGVVIAIASTIYSKSIFSFLTTAIFTGFIYFIINIAYADVVVIGTTGQSTQDATAFSGKIKTVIEKINARLTNKIIITDKDKKYYWAYIINPSRVSNAKTNFDPHKIFSIISSFSFIIAVISWIINSISNSKGVFSSYMLILFIITFILAILLGKHSIEVTSVGGNKVKLFLSKSAIEKAKNDVINGIQKNI